MKLIVHADDFGISEAINEGIVHAHTRGIVTSASIMATGAAFEHAIVASRTVPDLDVGVHLTLVEQAPLLPPRSIPTLVGPDGKFFDHATTFARNYAAGRISLEDVQRELDAQIDRVVGQVPVSHLDSHQHVHVLPGVSRVVARLARQRRIAAIRQPYERLRPYMWRSPSLYPRVAQMLALRALGTLGDRTGAVTDTFAGFVFGGQLDRVNLRTVLHALPNSGVCELMCHPGLRSVAKDFGHWGYRWSDELEALTDPMVVRYLREQRIELASFRSLGFGG